jgi:hypothetical protein
LISGPLELMDDRGDRLTARLSENSFFVFCFLLNPLFKGTRHAARRLYEAAMQCWSRLDPAERERFFPSGLAGGDQAWPASVPRVAPAAG